MFTTIILYSLIPIVTMVGGGIGATLRKPNGNFRSLILHFAAGVIFSVVSVEMLPDIVKEHKPIQTIIGFTLGFITMILIKHFTEVKEEKKEAAFAAGKIPFGMLAGVGVDTIVDGLLLGVGFAAGAKTGILLAIALGIEMMSLGMALATEMGRNGVAKNKSIAIMGLLGLLFFASAVIGGTLLQHASADVMEIVLSFGLSALLFLVTEELLIEAHEEEQTLYHTGAFFVGFLLFLILGIMV